MSGILLHRHFFPVEVLGPGRRVGLWFQGCSIRCSGCLAPETWDFDEKRKISQSELIVILKKYQKFHPDGVTISGGEPFDQSDGLLSTLNIIRDLNYPDVLVYSGYEYKYLEKAFYEHLSLIDFLITGPYNESDLNTRVWCGSDNQRIHLLSEKSVYSESELNSMVFEEPRKIQIEWFGDDIILIGIPRRGDVKMLKGQCLPPCDLSG